MMIDFGEAKIFKWQMTQAIHGVVGGELSGTDLLKQFADGFGVQSGTQLSALW